MKKFYSIIAILIASIGYAQIPAGYYNAATGTGYPLKTQLKSIITAGHVDKGYGSGSSQTNNGLWSAYGTTDRDNGIGYENDNTIVDIYSENPTGVDPYNFNFNTTVGLNAGQCGTYSGEGDCYNREHLIPQSYFDNIGTAFMKHDVQHVYPTDGKVNGMRNNYGFGKVSTASYTSQNGSKLGTASNSGYAVGYSGIVFEPIDEFKGDIARVFFYFATRYEDQMDDFYGSVTDAQVPCRVMFDGSINKVFSPTFLNILLTWNAQDPVSTKEIVRNNAAYVHQGNRNPYIDNNAYVTAIWGSPTLAVEDFDLLSNINIYPNPANDHRVNIETLAELDEIQLISVNGQVMQQINQPKANQNVYTLENLPEGFYFLKLNSDNQTIVKKIVIN
ncbi:endonuclease [Flavobacterium sp.]|uniref:endonuclease n=1 Tax=Flavobacterium sp. TaxID=239 RepID=UPI003D6C3569